VKRVGLFTRVYVFGIALLALFLAVASWLVSSQVVPVLNATTRSAARWLGEDLLADCGEPQRLSRRLDRMRALTPYEVTAVCGNGVSFGPPVTLSPAVQALLQAGREAEAEELDVFVGGDPTHYVVFKDRSVVALWLGIQWIVVLLVGLALAAWPVARSLTRPLQRLQMQVARFGTGDLSARVSSRRGDEIGSLAQSFDAMADQIAAQVEAQRLLVAGISHELRTPLHRMTSALAMLSAPDGSPEGEIRAEVLRDVRELSALLDDVFLLARLESAPATWEHILRRGPSTVGALVEDATSALALLHPPPNVDVRVESGVDSRSMTYDPRLAPRALKNLIDNALEHGRGSPVRVHVSTRGPNVTMVVTDEGPGIADERLDSVFRPFAPTAERRSGIGLGLALARAIATAHGGSLVAERPALESTGARFVLTLPLVMPGEG
jgi:two-component system OmpR family sensor kinase